jgi:predicted glycosyltransferase
MRILYDVNHPAHVHNLRPLARALEARGHQSRFVARDKDVTLPLLRHFGLPFEVLAPRGRGGLGLARELLLRELRFHRLAWRWRPRLIVGSSFHAARAARLTGARSALLNEDDLPLIRTYARLAYPLAHAVITPDCLAHERHGRHQLTYPSYQKLLYLHPDRFEPDSSVRAELGLGPDERFGLVRLSALDAHHDRGVRGLSGALLRQVVTAAGFRVFVCAEGALDPEFEGQRLRLPPWRVHDALALAAFYLGDSQSMATEAAVLGTPAFRINDFVGRVSTLRQLEDYGLAFGFRPGEEAALLERLLAVLGDPGTPQRFQDRRARMLAEKIDPLPWFVETLERLAEPPWII